ncbi:Large subunit GTPase 1, partial [Termitomyces sp. J132]
PKTKNPNPSGLGRAIINRKVKDARRQQESGFYTSDIDSSQRLRSVTQERDLDEFLNTAQLAGTEFTAERRNVKIIQQSTNASQNPYLLSEQEERNTIKKHAENKERLRVPRRPAWTKKMTAEELDKQEKTAFLDWRRGLAQLQEEEDLLLTPFERNLEVWRQLWRVLERSQLIVQIVDARNPLRFRCEDLEKYVQDVEGPEGELGTGKGLRKSLLLINKSDLLTMQQRCLWADYFDSHGIQYAFFSAAHATALQQAKRDALLSVQLQTSASLKDNRNLHKVNPDDDPPLEAIEMDSGEDSSQESFAQESSEDEAYFSAEDGKEARDPRVKILSAFELEDWFLSMAPDLSVFSDASGNPPSRLTVGLVGYPNVGKSSTINSLLGEKKVSVSSTPGKTKHFQTIHLSESILLCDCPGLVFPQFATTKAELVCDGVLPIDQLREYTGPSALLVQRIPKAVLEATYGLSIKVSGIEEGGDGKVRADNFLTAYAIARGYTRSGQGNPDEARAARYVLKDYVNGKLLYCRSPPGVPEYSFNQATHEQALLRTAGKKRAPVTRVSRDADTFVPTNNTEALSGTPLPANGYGSKSRTLDYDFFENTTALSSRPFIQSSLHQGEAFTRLTMYPHQNSVGDDGTLLNKKNTTGALYDKKSHFKPRRIKQRSGKGYD